MEPPPARHHPWALPPAKLSTLTASGANF
uniref:Uncharacterized protein n=1 Tax=Arundo donax TaxID=35708 RepID=A0A0A9GC43_ARUDO